MSLNKLFTYFIFFCTSQMLAANYSFEIDSARSAYDKGNYTKAINIYEMIIESNYESADLYYNLGNAYFKNNEIAMAILNYEKAKKLNINDDDILNNLKMANQRIEDKIEAVPNMFLDEWKTNISNALNEKQWSVLLIILFSITLLLVAVYLISGNRVLKQFGFFGAFAIAILSIFTFFVASNSYSNSVTKKEAIIIKPSVNINSSPTDRSTKLFILHEGTKVKILEENNGWTEIQIANNSVGWIKSNAIKSI